MSTDSRGMPKKALGELKLGRATLFAPLVAPVLYLAGVYLFSPSSSNEPTDVYVGLMLVSAYALPVSYIGTVAIGWPVLKVLQRTNRLTAGNLILTGLVAGGVLFEAFVLLMAGFHFEVLAIPYSVWYFAAGGVMGTGVAYIFSVISGLTKPSSG